MTTPTAPPRRFSRRATTVAVGGTAVLALSATAIAVSSSTSVAAPSRASGAVSYLGQKAAESAFQAAGTNADPVACQRPAPDNRVSTTIHCYTPNQLRSFYGLGPLTPSTNDGAGQTIVLADSYGSPSGSRSTSPAAPEYAPATVGRSWVVTAAIASRGRCSGGPGSNHASR